MHSSYEKRNGNLPPNKAKNNLGTCNIPAHVKWAKTTLEVTAVQADDEKTVEHGDKGRCQSEKSMGY